MCNFSVKSQDCKSIMMAGIISLQEVMVEILFNTCNFLLTPIAQLFGSWHTIPQSFCGGGYAHAVVDGMMAALRQRHNFAVLSSLPVARRGAVG
jgi:hypothetical protein